MKTITIMSIPATQMRYETCGDWFYKDGALQIRVLKELTEAEQVLVAVHELIEVLLCKNAGIGQSSVDKFDKKHEKEQDEVELGDLKAAPYRKQHCLATSVERMLAAEFGVCWNDYENHLSEIMETAFDRTVLQDGD